MRTICAWPPATGTGIWDISFGFAGSVTSMIIVPFGSSALPFSGFGNEVGARITRVRRRYCRCACRRMQ